MSKVVVIGATGHIGTYLIPRLVMAGHDVTAISRGVARPYQQSAVWRHVTSVTIDREAEEPKGRFGQAIAALGADIVVDLICFTEASNCQIADALEGGVSHFIHIGTIWTHGHATVVPTPESAAKFPFGDYGTAKAAIEADLLSRARMRGFPATIVHPGHIVGPGWAPLNPAGHFNPAVFSTIARGDTLPLPNFGLETVHHVHADDVAQVVMRAIDTRSAAVGESFHAVSDAAVTLRGYAEAMYRWFGHEPRLSFAGFEEWAKSQDADEAKATWEHIARSPNCSIEKGRRLLGYAPRYTSLEAAQEAVTWLISDGQVQGR
ncbi:NAD-dependent epimerase/dehydratase family protein [Devosia oryziradicis]|uniref:NAD-dependent epimerase/dehydratase family protein n=1 Tax=Devosia oryziradicis TaxID=2801335 RepID=A0ABX7BSP9_9HYPH|nr:NAD-dependent epimerase/dehydratase family protein [Devosia oryziradicis]QQR34966.1 NAD-dependent epimerase/dehydratase family protein [Devosia oryziradicis]